MTKYCIRPVISILLILSLYSCNSIKQLEATAYRGNNVYEKLQAARLLHKKQPFNERGIEVILDYYREQKFDSAHSFFDKLTAKYPNNPEPYLLRETFGVYPDEEKTYGENDIQYLQKALEIDNKNKEALKRLADLYYRDFIYPLEVEKPDNFVTTVTGLLTKEDSLLFFPPEINDTVKKQSRYENSAQNALFYYDKLWEYYIESQNTIYFPLKQLECYLDISSNKYSYPESNDFFPAGHFANLDRGWECNFTNSYLYDIESAQEFGNDWITEQLKGLNEPALFNEITDDNKEIFRFTWLRSFNNPIAVRLEKTESGVYLYYKVGRGMGGYKPKGIKRKGKKKLSVTEWDSFAKLVEAMNYDSLENNYNMMMVDGAEWVLEHKTQTQFQAKKTNIAGEDFTIACLYLVKLANIKIAEDDIY